MIMIFLVLLAIGAALISVYLLAMLLRSLALLAS
jgi:hypothetical protein